MTPMQSYIVDRSAPITEVGCWLWLQSLGSHGYGNAYWGGQATVAHRLSYSAFVGPIPAGLLVQHSCDNRWCVSPDHLALGTDATNATDKTQKGRAAFKLTPDAVREIRRRVAAGEYQHVVAKDFGVHQANVWRVVHRLIWGHVQ